MKSLESLFCLLLLDCGRKCAAPVARSVETLKQRTRDEGDGFLTITLPAFCRALEQALASGRMAPDGVPNFKKSKFSARIPAFLSEFVSRIFDAEGNLLADPSIDCIRCVRQLCLFAKKIVRPCSKARVAAAIEDYAQCDCEVSDTLPASQLARYYRRVADILCDSLALRVFDVENLVPRHGPGATREHIKGNQKYVHRTWHARLAREGMTYLRYGYGSDVVATGDFDPDVWPMLLDPGAEPPVRVVLVPKTMKTPRVIAIEPVCMQYMQQALSRFLMQQIESCAPTSGRVNFADQSKNQEMALSSSASGDYATLDMKEASDRVSYAHAKTLFASAPKLWAAIDAARSTCAELPTGEILSLSKFASMGSALCFPVESLVFFTSIVASRILREGSFPTPQTVFKYGQGIYVYGDDLIVPVGEAVTISADLEALGFRVNRHKSFWTGKFRESCGVDAFDGHRVEPVYLRTDAPADRGDVKGILSWVATANQLFDAGYTVAALSMRKHVERLIGPLPVIPRTSPAVGWYEYSEHRAKSRYNRSLQRAEMYAWVPYVPRVPDLLQGRGAAVKCFLTGGREIVLSNRDHLATSPGPSGPALRRRWVPMHY